MSAPTTAAAPASTITLEIRGMTCASCQVHVQRALQGVAGVASASVNLMAHTAQVQAQPNIATDPLNARLLAAVRDSGYEAKLASADTATTAPTHTQPTADSSHSGLRAALALAAGALSMGLAMSPVGHVDAVRWLLCALAVAVMLFAAPQIYVAAWRAALHRTTNMNTLVAVGTLAAFSASLAATIAPAALGRRGIGSATYFDAVMLILAFLLVGRWLEERARLAATAALRGFAALQPSQARLLTPPPGPLPELSTLPETLLPLDALEPGDLLRVLPGDRVPLDGIILQGRSSVDESMLTGEPLPVTRSPGDTVRSGTLNLDGALVLRATSSGANSTLAQLQRLLSQAQASRAPMQRLADRVSAIFVPTILGLSALTFAVWAIVLNTGGLHQGLARPLSVAIAVLIVACPCAMGLAVPAAVTVAIGRAAQLGLLIRGGESLERLASLDTLALDKTGTLTLGQPTIAALVRAARATLPEPTLLAWAAAAEAQSTHPLAAAVVAFGHTRPDLPAPPAVTDLTVLPGIGLTAVIEGHRIALGNASLVAPAELSQLAAPDALSQATPLYLLVDDHLQAAFYATDQLRPGAAAALAELRALGVQPLLLTGDTAASAAPIAATLGITDVRAHLLPADKLAAIQSLQSAGHHVGMAGDGINDAAALASADAGLAMAQASDLAREAGDVLLLHADLALLPLAIRLARHSVRVMRQNLGWALVYNLIGVPLAAGVFYPHFHILLSPVLAAAAMALSSVSVLANSLRLRRL